LDYFVLSVDFHCTGKYFASGHAANNAKLWSLETDEILQDLKGDRNNPDQNESEADIFCKVKFSPSGKYLAMCNDVGFIYLFKSN
jgi:WD40 repeat protein